MTTGVARVAYWVVLFVCAVLSLLSLAAGAVGWLAADDPLLDWLGVQGVLDYGLSGLSILVAGALAAGRDRSWSTRLLLLAMVASAGAFNVQAIAVVMVFDVATGLQAGLLHHVVLPGVAVAAFVLALLVFPPERESRGGAPVFLGVGALLLAGIGAALLPPIVSCVLFFGYVAPVVGVVVLPAQIRGAPTATARTQARLLFSVVAVASAIATVLAAITFLMWATGWSSLLLLAAPADGASGEPTALLFWFSRLAGIAISAAVFVATRRGGLRNAERVFSRGLAAGLTAALVGGGYCVVRTSMASLLVGDGAFLPAALATVFAAATLRPAYLRAERWTDRLLFGHRPTPYRALAGIAALSRATATDAPDLTRVAEAVGRGLGATTCRLTVVRPGLRDRGYTWTEKRGDRPDELVEVAVHHGAEAIGTLAVDHAAVAGLQAQRHHLLEDVADSLGVVLQASRYGIELERQLRAAVAHAGEIAASRRAVVAEMDGERRRIERDLHDGAQHHLVSLRLTLGLVEHQVATAQFDKARERLVQVADQIDVAESILAETAMGVSSPLLAEAGLVRALEKELAGGAEAAVVVDASGVAGVGRFPDDIESAVYFCCLEAVNNARKHARGAAVEVRLSTEDGRLRFTVRDDGPGWDQRRDGHSQGRGLRNVVTRVAAVGGRIEVRSAPGKGTTVDGSVPLPGAALAAHSLPDQVREAVREALECYPDTAAVQALAERLEAPPRIGAPPDLAALAPDFAGAAIVDPATPADASVLLLRRGADGEVLPPDGCPPHRPAHSVGALVVERPIDAPARLAAADCAARPEVRRLCHVVVPLAADLARAAVQLSDEQYGALTLAAGQPVPAVARAGHGPREDQGERADPLPFEPATVRFAVAAIRSGRASTREALADALVRGSGLPRLRELVAERLVRRAEALKARSVLLALEDLVRVEPPPEGGRSLRYRLDRIRAEAHELVELDVLDALREGETDLPDGERHVAERLLGAAGSDPRSRLGLTRDAGRTEIVAAAAEQLAHWQRRAANPLSGVDVRRTADVLLQVCERMLVSEGNLTRTRDLTHRG